MTEWNKRAISYPSQFGILLGLLGAGLILSLVVTYATWKIMIGGSYPTTTSEMLQDKYYDVNMVIQGLSTLCFFFLPAVGFAKICYRKEDHFLGFTTYFNYKQVLLVVAILMAAIPFSGAVAELNRIIPLPDSWEKSFKAMEDSRKVQEQALIKIDTLHRYLLSLFMIGLLPAIFEETLFRGGLQNLLARWTKSPWTAIIITSIIFSLIHMSYYGFLVRFSLGVILGLVFHYSKNLWMPILLHLLFNGLQVTALYVMTKSGINKPKDIETSFPLWIGIAALFILVYLFISYKKISEQELAKYDDPILKDFLADHQQSSTHGV